MSTKTIQIETKHQRRLRRHTEAGEDHEGPVRGRRPLQLEDEGDVRVLLVAAVVLGALQVHRGAQVLPLPESVYYSDGNVVFPGLRYSQPVPGVEVEELDRRHVLVLGEVDLIPVRGPRAELELARLPVERPEAQFLSEIIQLSC